MAIREPRGHQLDISRGLSENVRSSKSGYVSSSWPVCCLQATKIFVNGIWVGVHRDPAMLVRTLRQMRRQVNISTEVILQDLAPAALCYRSAAPP